MTTFAAKGAKSFDRLKPFPPQDIEGPGLKNNDQNFLGVSRSLSSPVLGDGKSPKRVVKCTFGTADRFRTGRQSCSPHKDLYYAHSKFLTDEDYLASGKSCSMGGGHKTDFTNPFRGHASLVSPATYSIPRKIKTSGVERTGCSRNWYPK
mmetsp:Transcript_40506/g.91386  ORF Transcript_40506/g.91386 Transcript_40506/m.91386 type:complete len:150 (-) Transcript_40506:67-516(-)